MARVRIEPEPSERRRRPDVRPLPSTTGKLLTDFVANGGRVWACGACTGPRGITADDLIEGATIVTAANLVEAVTDGATTIGF